MAKNIDEGRKKMQNNPRKEDDNSKRHKRNAVADEDQFVNQAGMSEEKVNSEHSGGQYHFKKDKLGKNEDRNEGEAHKAPDLSEPNIEGGPGGSVYEAGNNANKGKNKAPR